MTFPNDYNQHLLAYIQAWRQLLSRRREAAMWPHPD